MASFQHVLEYICKFDHGPYPLDETRLFLTMYLVDWRSAIERSKPVTDITWQIEEFGPAPTEPTLNGAAISALVTAAPDFTSISDRSLAIRDNVCHLSAEESQIVDFVIERTSKKSPAQLAQLVFSTFPFMTQPSRAPLNLVALAQKYNRDYRHASDGGRPA